MQTQNAAWFSRLREIPGRWRMAGAGAFLVALGFAASAGSALVVAVLAAAAGLLALTFCRPKWVLGGMIVTLVVAPTYLRTPVIPGPSTFPLSLALTLLLAGVLALGFFLGRSGPLCGSRGRRLGMMFFAFAATALVTLWLDSGTVAASVQMWVKVFVLTSITCVVLLRLLQGKDDVDWLFGMLVTGCVVVVFYAIGEFATGKNVLLSIFHAEGSDEQEWFWQGADFARVEAVHRVYGTFTNPIEFGIMMSMVYPYALMKLIHAGSPRTRLSWAVVAALIVAGAALTFSRGPILAMILCTVVLAVLVKPLRKYVVYASFAAAIVGVVTWQALGQKLEQRTLDTDNITLRFKLWDIALGMARDHPVAGVGFANFPVYHAETIRRHHIDTRDTPNAERIKTSENIFLQLAAETGLVGLAGFTGTFVLFFVLAAQLYRRLPPDFSRDLVLSIAVGAIAYLINGLFVTCYLLYVITITMGVLFAALMILDRDAPRPAS